MVTSPETRPRVLCVDDEPQVLEGLQLHLRRHFEVLTATSAIAGLEVLDRERVAVVLSDMRMPGMDGAAFLARARQAVPDAVRVLLTGHADMSSAISAVNEGQIFRFLTKPCPPATVIATIRAAAEQHRLQTAERVLLEQTLHGCVKALTDILSLANPAAFGRALRVKALAAAAAQQLDLPHRWQLEIAAMLSEIGMVTIPADTVERVQQGSPLSERDRAMLDRVPDVADQVLAHLPRLESVRAILAAASHEPKAATGSDADSVNALAAVLIAARDFDAQVSRGESASDAVAAMRKLGKPHPPVVLDALETVAVLDRERFEILQLRLEQLRPGMVFAEDVSSSNGVLLVARGYEVTPRFLERLQNAPVGTVREPVRVMAPRTASRQD